jgi:predicted XRE-type DNA-binding protein
MHEHDTQLVESCGNVFVALDLPSEEAAILAMRADLMACLRLLIQAHGWTEVEAARRLQIDASCAADLMRGNWDRLVALATRAGLKVELKVAA